MSKQQFLSQLRARLYGLPRADVEERLNFYSEMIDDRIEEGCSEQEAVFEIGSVDEIAAQIIADIPFMKIARKRIKPKRRLKIWEITLLALGSPIWFSLLISLFAVIFSLYASLWSLVASLWAVFASVVACAFAGVIGGVCFAIGGQGLVGICIIGAGFVCAGLAVFLSVACKAATKGTVLLAKKITLGIKKCFVKVGEA